MADRLRLRLNLKRLTALIGRLERAGVGKSGTQRRGATTPRARLTGESETIRGEFAQRHADADAARRKKRRQDFAGPQKGKVGALLNKAYTRLFVGVWLAATSEELVKKIGRRIVEMMRGQKDFDEAIRMIVWSLVPEILREGIPIIQAIVEEGLRKQAEVAEQERQYQRYADDFNARMKDSPGVRDEAREVLREQVDRYEAQRRRAQDTFNDRDGDG